MFIKNTQKKGASIKIDTHEYHNLQRPNGEKIFEAYAQQKTPSAYRIFWHYDPEKT
ncbi:MAG: hypothetical protein WD055_03075 [Candidatus Dependentiae bacterium]